MKNLITALAVIVCANFVFAQAPGCPSIDAGSNDTIDCYSDPCVEIVPTFHQTGETTTYTVDSIAYVPPFPFTGGTSIFIGIEVYCSKKGENIKDLIISLLIVLKSSFNLPVTYISSIHIS